MIFAGRHLQGVFLKQHPSSTRPYLIWQRPLIQSVGMDSENSWNNSAAQPSLLAIVRQFHDGMMVGVLDNGESSESFLLINGVKQGCVRAPTLLSEDFSHAV